MATALQECQAKRSVVADCKIANIGTGNGFTIPIPVNGLLTELTVDTTTAFDSGTTTTLTVTDGTTTFVNAVDVKSTGRETVSNLGKFYPSGGTLTVSLAETGDTATAGRAFVVASYVILGRSNEIQA